MKKKDKDTKVFCEIFRSLGFKRVEAHYNGYGDSGNLEDISLIDNSGKIISEVDITSIIDGKLNNKKNSSLNLFSNNIKEVISEHGDLESYLEDFLWKLLPAGFEINEGSHGDIDINLKTCEIDLDHSENPEYDGDDSEFS